MPFYEYQCRSCGHQLEVLQKISDKPLRKCPACGKGALTKLVSAPVFRLKGSGWYETDFKSDQDKKRNLAAGDGEAPAAKADDAGKSSDAGKTAKAAATETPAAKPASDKPAADKPSASRSSARTKSPAKASKTARRPAARKSSRR
ncbi:MAG: zinc ribbon domain-containing protein [Gammaproteobacteria bacterium]|nr:zinc ribbon domain-containing protein [Gammaproteobacteria bacterium]